MADGFTRQQKVAVYERSAGWCEMMWLPYEIGGCRVTATDYHHRRPRGMGGGGLNAVSNCLHLCRVCHMRVESMRTWSRENGFLVSQYEDPAEVAVWWRCATVAGHREYVFLADDGHRYKQLEKGIE